MSHKWKSEGQEYLYFVDTPDGPMVGNSSVKSLGKLISEGMRFKYRCKICNASCVNINEQPLQIPVPCTYDVN